MMATELSPSEIVDRRVAAVLERVWRKKRAHRRAQLYLARRCRALSVPEKAPTLEGILRERQRREQVAARRLVRLSLPVTGALPDWMERPSVPDLARAGAAEGLMPRSEPLPPPGKGTTVFAGGQGGLGLNGMKLYEYEDTGETSTLFGWAPSQWQDPPELRAQVLRQFGKRDLLWDFLTAWHDQDLRVPIPKDPDEIRDLVLNGAAVTSTTGPTPPTNIARFGELFVDAWRAGVKLRFTFLTLGLGSARLVSSADIPTGEGTIRGIDPEYQEAITDDAYHPLVTQRLVVRMYWTEDYAIPSSPSDPYAEFKDRWSRIALDLYSSDKKAAMFSIAKACAELLVRAEANARSKLGAAEGAAFDLAQVLDGIELFNEVDGRCVVADDAFFDPEDPGWVGTAKAGHWDPEAHGRAWGAFWVAAAVGFVWGFRELRLSGDWTPPTDGWLPTLYLPGVSSTSMPDETTGTYTDALSQDFWYKHDFLDAFLAGVSERWTSVRTILGMHAAVIGVTLDDLLPPLSEVVGGVDYHWYHGERPTLESPLPPLSAQWLAMEVQALSDLLTSHGVDGSVTVFESGVSATDAKAAFVPEVDAVGPVTGGVGPLEQHQANEVFRRLLMAAAGGTEQVGWHAWMSLGGGFEGFGLRVDTGASDRDAAESTARAAYFAFSRLAVFFRDASAIRLVEPDPLPTRLRDQLLLDDETGEVVGDGVTTPGAWVFEVQGASFGTVRGRDLSDHGYAYVVLSDPTLSGVAPVVMRLQATAPGTTAEPVQVEAHPVMPTSAWELASAGDPDVTLPLYDLEASLPATIDLASVAPDQWELVSPHRCMPVIVASRVPLTVVS